MTYTQIASEQKVHAVKDLRGIDKGLFTGKSLCGMLANWDKVVSGPSTCKRCKEVEEKKQSGR